MDSNFFGTVVLGQRLVKSFHQRSHGITRQGLQCCPQAYSCQLLIRRSRAMIAELDFGPQDWSSFIESVAPALNEALLPRPAQMTTVKREPL